MLMTIALVLFGTLSLITAYIWERRIRKFNTLAAHLKEEFGFDDVDISGKRKYTRCISHRWIMRNVIHGDYTNSERSLGDFIGENTLFGTIAIGIVMGILPVILVFIAFQSFVLVGASMVTIVAAVFVIRSPGEVEISYDLLSYLEEQDSSELGIGDAAYTRISANRIRRWEKTLMVVGAISITIAPWGGLLPDLLAMLISGFFTLFLERVFLPVASISFPLALILFVSGVPLFAGVLYILAKRLSSLARLRRNEIPS